MDLTLECTQNLQNNDITITIIIKFQIYVGIIEIFTNALKLLSIKIVTKVKIITINTKSNTNTNN